MALADAVKQLPSYLNLIKALWGEGRPRVVFVTDSQPLQGWLRKCWVQSDPRLQGVLNLVLERIREIDASVLYVPTGQQRADRHTKFICAAQA